MMGSKYVGDKFEMLITNLLYCECRQNMDSDTNITVGISTTQSPRITRLANPSTLALVCFVLSVGLLYDLTE